MSSHYLRSAVSVGIPIMVLTPFFAHFIVPPSLQLVLVVLAQYLSVELCICFHQFLDEGSMMKIKIVINLIAGEGEGQFRYPFLA